MSTLVYYTLFILLCFAGELVLKFWCGLQLDTKTIVVLGLIEGVMASLGYIYGVTNKDE